MNVDPQTRAADVRVALIAYRAENNLTLRALAKRIGGITGQTIGNIERGAVWPQRKTALRLERFLIREGALNGKEAA